MSGGSQVLFFKASLVAAVSGGFSILGVPILFLFAVVFHQRLLSALALLVLAISAGALAVRDSAKIWNAFALGRWTSWQGEPIERIDQPARFRRTTAVQGAFVAARTVAAASLINGAIWLARSWSA